MSAVEAGCARTERGKKDGVLLPQLEWGTSLSCRTSLIWVKWNAWGAMWQAVVDTVTKPAAALADYFTMTYCVSHLLCLSLSFLNCLTVLGRLNKYIYVNYLEQCLPWARSACVLLLSVGTFKRQAAPNLKRSWRRSLPYWLYLMLYSLTTCSLGCQIKFGSLVKSELQTSNESFLVQIYPMQYLGYLTFPEKMYLLSFWNAD